MKVIFGGAFNPVTNAHIKVYEFLKDKLDFTEFIFLPVSSAYTKSELVSNHHRKNMLELAIEDFDDIRVSDLEINDTDFLGTYQSLIRFSDREDCEVGFVIGADNLEHMHTWINIEGILSEFKIIVIGRDHLDIRELISNNKVLKKYQNSFIIFDEFQMEISSTKFRQTMDQSTVPKKVYHYIMENELYKGKS